MASTGTGVFAPGGVGQGQGESIWRTLSSASYQSPRERDSYDIDEESEEPIASKAEEWAMMPEVKHMRSQAEKDKQRSRKLGVTFTNLTVKGVSADAAIAENVLSQFNIPAFVREARQQLPQRIILDNVHGCVRPGDMLLVLGRPGAGCTTLLKMLANRRNGYAGIEGEVKFGTMDHKEAEQYRGQIVMNSEDDVFFPTLTVQQTIDFATRMKVPAHLPSDAEKPQDFQQKMRDFLLESVGISHTKDTKVGNEYVRGVSGGERKRVSITEVLATRGSVFCWDNPIRGLDASTALEFAKAIRALTDIFGLSSILTLYQAGNGIYHLFDKVLVLDEGKEIYYGPKDGARPFMESQGFICDDSANIGDFLTGVTVPTERQVRDEMRDSFPRTAGEIRSKYEQTSIMKEMGREYKYPTTEAAQTNTIEFKEAVRDDKNKSLPKSSPLTANPLAQIRACVIRQYQVIWGDKATFIIKQVSTTVQALIVGSLFYKAASNSSGLFLKGGTLFLSVLYHSLLAMSEVTDSFSGRAVLAKHRSLALYHPAAFCLAQIAVDIPVLFFQVSQFSLIVYFMVGLRTSASAFFTYWIIVFAATMAMTACFRAIGAGFSTFDAASKVSGFLVSALVMYCGYLISKPEMHPWFVWIYWINPLGYAFQALLANEFHGQIIPCVAPNLIPFGSTYTNSAPQACAGVGGARPGADFVTGDQYLASLSYSHSNLWRNFGILWCWWLLFVAITVVFTSRWTMDSNAGHLLVPREGADKNKHMLPNSADEETSGSKTPGPGSTGVGAESDAMENQLVRNTSVFTWKNLSYVVKTPSGDRTLLDNVQGWVKPGMLGALMGSSGAGKTTLMDVLAQRKTAGTIHGSIMVDGRPLPVSFQRDSGYCEQLDVHEPLATVREALEFSAFLRQARDVPRAEKIRYVDTIIDLLELRDLEHTLIGRPGAGLSIEQRKRVTIGVELVSKPSILIFLDEPTSGLDGQAAYNTVRFLRKLADAGQAVLVTIHQPSAQLFAQFDTLLLLARGGHTVYFGDIGDNAATIKEYFAKRGAPCPLEANPAEHMIDVITGKSSKDKNWAQVWLDSPEHENVVKELDRMIEDAANKEPGTVDDGHEFALSLWDQTKLVTQRMNVSLYRNTDYANNKISLHVGSALFNGFSFWMIGDSVGDLQQRLFTIFNFIFVAPGVINQLQPLFIQRRDIYEAREKKSKMYSWIAFTTGLIVSELPYLCICAVLYFFCWYYTVGFPTDSNKAGATFFVMLMYEFVYTGIGQFIAAYAPNAIFASLVNPLLIGTLVSFCGILVPYAEITAFWRYWMYYLNPFNYLMGSLLVFSVFDAPVYCKESEFAIFDPPNPGQTCASYLADYLGGSGSASNLTNPDATSGCRVCQYSRGSDYLYTLNLKDYYYGWRDAAIVVLFAISSYGMVYLLMKLRTKQSKTAE